jgi:hypothetical protein
VAALRLAARGDRFRLFRSRALSLRRGRRGWDVEVATPSGGLVTREGLDACVLAASAIGNIQILANTIGESITTTITDHFCVGAYARVGPGEPLASPRHSMLWDGYRQLPSLSANLFVQQLPNHPNGDRMLSFLALIQQGASPRDYSELLVQPSSHQGLAAAHITTAVSAADRERVDEVRKEILRLASEISHGPVVDITPPRPDGGGPDLPERQRRPRRRRTDGVHQRPRL